MMQPPSFRRTWLPLGLAVLALAVLNFGLYTRLAPTQPVESQGGVDVDAAAFSLPYSEDFATLETPPYEIYGGDWEIRDETLVQLSTSGYDLMSFVPMGIPPDQTYRFSAVTRFLGGSSGAGLMFNAQQTTSRQQSHMARFNVDTGQLWLIYGYFGDDSDFIGQGSAALSIPPEDDAPHTLTVEVSSATYALFVDGVQVAADVPLSYQGGAVGFMTAAAQASFDDVRVEPLNTEAALVTDATPADTTASLVFSDDFDVAPGNGESPWVPISGQWAYADGALVQSQADGFDLSSVYQAPVMYPLTLRTELRHQQGVGAGLLFNLAAPADKNGGHMVRYVDDPAAESGVVAWGYFDAAGVFQGQGSALVDDPGTALHTLEIRADGVTYSVLLDDESLSGAIPMQPPSIPAYIGLTTSQSATAFESVAVYSSATAEVPNMPTDADINVETATGDWFVNEEGTITQRASELTDYVAGTGLAGEQFTISVDITLPTDNPDAGAGILFHMAGRDDRALGTLIRFGSGGQELFWGRYDAQGVFAGEGGIPLSLEAAERHTLLLSVRAGRFDIAVDGETLVQDIPLESSSGWIGLASFSGPVTFADVRLVLGQ